MTRKQLKTKWGAKISALDAFATDQADNREKYREKAYRAEEIGKLKKRDFFLEKASIARRNAIDATIKIDTIRECMADLAQG